MHYLHRQSSVCDIESRSNSHIQHKSMHILKKGTPSRNNFFYYPQPNLFANNLPFPIIREQFFAVSILLCDRNNGTFR